MIMKPTTLNLLLRVFLICIVLGVVVVFFNLVLGAFVIIIAILGSSFSGWKASRMLRANPDAFRDQTRLEKKLGLKGLPSWLTILLVVSLVVSNLGFFGLFSFDPLVNGSLSLLTIALLIFYFLQKRKV